MTEFNRESNSQISQTLIWLVNMEDVRSSGQVKRI